MKCEQNKTTWGGVRFANTGLVYLQKCLSVFNSCVITSHPYSFAIHKRNSRYYVFDSHGRNNKGIINN